MTLKDAVVAAAERVNSELPPTLRENAYHKAMLVELSDAGIKHSTESTVPVKYRGMSVARMHPDLEVENDEEKLIVELKATRGEVGQSAIEQLENYLKFSEDVDGGLAITFGRTLDWEER